jgi:hypothetical protein
MQFTPSEVFMDTVARGAYKVEFYTLLPTIRNMYETGNVVVKIIYDDLYKAGKITMSYHRFADYFRKEVSGKVKELTPKKEVKVIVTQVPWEITSDQSLEENSSEIDKDSPIIIRSGTDVQKKFNPHAVEIDPKNKW